MSGLELLLLEPQKEGFSQERLYHDAEMFHMCYGDW